MTLRFSSAPPGLLHEEAGETASLKNDVFISHAPGDIGAAEAIVAALEASNLRCFMAPRDIPAGMERATALVDAICETRLFLLVYSHSANRSLQMTRELQLVHDRHIAVFPVGLDDSQAAPHIDFFLKRQGIFRGAPLGDQLAALMDAVHARLGNQAQRRPG